MVRYYMEKAKSVIKWGKVILPLSFMRYFPPLFIVRNPILEGVTAAFNQGHEVATIVFNIKNLKELAEIQGDAQHVQMLKKMKKTFRHCIEKEIDANDVIALHDLYSDGLTLLLKVDYDRHTISDIDNFIKNITFQVENSLIKQNQAFKLIIEAGYMFVEKNHYSVQHSVDRAHRQAIAVAERKVEREFNEMMFTIKKIISKKEINLLAQPIIDLATNKIHAWEMLTRGPKGSVLEDPVSLISVARQTGALYDLEMIVIEKTLQQIKSSKCRAEIFVNCTPITLGNIRFTRDLKNLMEQYRRISPKQITFEITERDSIEEMKDFKHNLKILRLMGFKFAVDDTGAGYSSLNTISQIMPDIIKIDRSVIEDIDKNTVKESMLKGLLLVAREAGSLVVAEGIENKEEASVLSRYKVDLAQGYFYAKPTALVQGIAT